MTTKPTRRRMHDLIFDVAESLQRDNRRLRGWLRWLDRTSVDRELGLHDAILFALMGGKPPRG